MRRMLDPTKVGGLPSTIEFDKDGNRKVKKNLGVDGKLTLTSLVSNTNPDGDITKELGSGEGSKIYLHSISIAASEYQLFINIYSTSNTKLTYKAFEQLVLHYGKINCNGFYKTSSMYGIANHVEYNSNVVELLYFIPQYKTQQSSDISSNSSFDDTVAEIL